MIFYSHFLLFLPPSCCFITYPAMSVLNFKLRRSCVWNDIQIHVKKLVSLYIMCIYLKAKEDTLFFWEWKKQHSITKVYAFVSPFPKAQIFCNLEKWMWLRKRSAQRSYGFPSVIALSWSNYSLDYVTISIILKK